VFPLWQGVHLHGIFPLHTSHSGYDLYTFSPTTNTQVLAGGGHLWWKSSEEQVSLGVSQQIKKNGSDTVDTLGADARVKFAPFTLTSEFAKNFGSGDQPWSFYIEPDYDLNDQSVILYVFADYLVNPINVTGTSAASFSDPFKKWQYGTGVNWLPTSYTRLRGGITFNQYLGDTPLVSASARNYWSLDFSAGLAF
jgi:hypothetical protein